MNYEPELQPFLKESALVDFSHPEVLALAQSLAQGCTDDTAIAEKCFLHVRDNIRHSGDYRDTVTTLKASEVLHHKTGWCYAKSILLAALLRANGIPTGFCYQRLSCSEYLEDIYCLHGLNAVYLKAYGWPSTSKRTAGTELMRGEIKTGLMHSLCLLKRNLLLNCRRGSRI